MSRAMDAVRAEISDEEAEEAEAPEPEPEPEPAPEPEPEPETIDAKALKAMEREEDRHEEAVTKLLGEASAVYHRCPLCATFPSGFVPVFQSVPDDHAAELGTAVFAYFNGPELVEPHFKDARTMQRCGECDGWGQVRSGARNATHRLEQCPACTGNGYTPRLDPAPGDGMAGQATFTQTGQPASATPYLDWLGQPTHIPPDYAGRGWGDPQYGQAITTQAQTAA